jgi:hypothetical protein
MYDFEGMLKRASLQDYNLLMRTWNKADMVAFILWIVAKYLKERRGVK